MTELLVRDEDDVFLVLRLFQNQANIHLLHHVSPEVLGAMVREQLDQMVAECQLTLGRNRVRQLFTQLGALLLTVVGGHEAFDEDKFVALLLSKHRDYGPASIVKYGPIGTVIKIDQKIERIANLASIDGSIEHESLFDSWQDALGYCILGYLAVNHFSTGVTAES